MVRIIRDTWTVDQVKILKSMWGKGYTARQIAAKIPGKTRNAIIGKAHRLRMDAIPRTFRAKHINEKLRVERIPLRRRSDPYDMEEFLNPNLNAYMAGKMGRT